ncbi:hypothetical protein [Candidatus Anaplasma sp. TIGMIC]|uniref:hypothetical protein n=1 Tax=Candidatus Anaplasma sp. TIGMIC TaxID=3020713 RepID=UPI00232B82F8|nr:hypothetical protein [Candidatus Anaplasma sp. TIGMIC]MDB1135404.1 hypothetical protein [Candidatus Anaplasma sp. TIGMIC]
MQYIDRAKNQASPKDLGTEKCSSVKRGSLLAYMRGDVFCYYLPFFLAEVVLCIVAFQ